MKLSDIPQQIIDQYNLNDLVAADGYVYMEIRRAMYGLKQSGMLANKELKKVLAKAGYFPSAHTPGLFAHKTRPISFTLVVDDFGVKYINKADALHLEKTISDHYPMKSDWTGDRYIGIDLNWDYTNRTVKLSMKGYVKKALLQFQHKDPTRHYAAPSQYIPPNYGQKQQMTNIDLSKPMTKAQTHFLQQITGKFLYYARAVDCTMLHALNDLATQTHSGTQKTMKAVAHFLNYCASNPEAATLYRVSDMILHINSDTAYLVAPKARSRAGGFYYMGNRNKELINGPVAVNAKIIKNVMSSASEAEIGALYMNAKDAVPMRTTLAEMNHPQPPTPIRTDNSTANGIVNSTIRQNRSKAIDMRFYWLRDRVNQKQFHIHWAPGAINLADFFTKHHSPQRHLALRPLYVHTKSSPTGMQGCIKLLTPLTNKITPESAIKLNIPAGTLTALAVRARARARAPSRSNTALSGLLSLSLSFSKPPDRSHYSLSLFPSQE